MDITIAREFFDEILEVSIGLKNLFDVKDLTQTTKWNQNVEENGNLVNREMTLKNTFPTMWGRTLFLKIKINI